MKEFQTADIRNFAIVGHASSGKTMLSEDMLACSGIINRPGTIQTKNTVSDYHDDEHERQISIHTSLLHTEWLGKKFNIIDTPGYTDFIGERLGAIKVSDFILLVINAAQGVEVVTEQVSKYASDYGIPKFIVVNDLDKENINFEQRLEQIKKSFGDNVFPMDYPMNAGPGFNQVLDVMRSEVITYNTDRSGKFEELPAEGEWKEKVDKLHQELIEHVAESDDTLLEKFLEEGSLSEEEMREWLHTALKDNSFIPLFCVSGEFNIGIPRLMDFIAKYGYSPLDREKIKALDSKDSEITIDINDPNPVLYIFKTLSEAHIGEMSLFRLYSGTLKTGMDLHNSNRNITERIGQILALNGKERDSVKVLHAGDIGAVVKLKDTHTDNTLCSADNIVKIPQVKYPSPNIHAALKAKSKGEEDKIAIGLAKLHEEDPTFIYHVDSELHQTVISGQGELHLKVTTSRLKGRFNVDIDLEKPKIPYRETIKGRAESKYRHKKQSGGAGQFAEVWLRVEPKGRGEGVEFTNSLTGMNVDRVFVPSVEKGVNAACRDGILAGYRVVDLKVDFYDGKQHPVDSKDIAFQIAGQFALKQAFMDAKPCLLEPLLNIEIKVPEDYMGEVMGDISSRRGKILGMDSEGSFKVIKAQAPQAELYGFSTSLRSLTGGRGIHTEEFSHYEQMPPNLEQKVIQESRKE